MSTSAKQRKNLSRKSPFGTLRGQNITEYMILVVGVLVVVILATSKGGFFTRGVDRSINMMFDSVEDMATVQCLGAIDDVNGQWSGWGAWAGCGWDPDSSSCLEYSTHICNNPSPQCGGTECTLEITVGSTTPLNRTERKSQACYAGSWTPGTCPAFSCTGTCGSTVGTCTTGDPTCDTGCCDPADKPATTVTCTKPAYPDVWSGLGFGACSTSCDEGISSQTVTCSGMCCDADIKPPTRRACTDGCCAQTFDIGLDIENNVQFTASFGPQVNGQSFSVPCPSGYAGNPTSACTATANLSCTGNDSYVPPASCYNIDWSAVVNTCVPADCDPVTADVGYGGYALDYTFPFTLHGNPASVDCSTLRQNGVGHTGGSASYDCWLGAWRNLNAPCIPNCAETTLDTGSGQTGLFPETTDGAVGTSSCQCGYSGTPQRQCDEAGNNLGEWGNLIAGTECAIKRCGDPGGEKFPVLVLVDDGGNPIETVEGTFGPVDHLESSDLDCQTQIDNRLEGSASMDCDWCANTLNGWTNPQYSCIPRHCEPITDNSVDMGAGVKGNLPWANHNDPETTLSCADYDPLFTGDSKYKCVYGEWTPVSLGCGAKDCVDWTTNIGGTVSGTFTGGAGSHGATRSLTCGTIDSNYKGEAGSTCCYGDWYAAGTICASIMTPSGTNVYSPDPVCVAYACQTDYVAPPVTNATSCGDDADLTADEYWSVVDDCTPAKTCEWACNDTFKKVGNTCVDTECKGSNPDPNGYAVACGTQKPLVDTDRWLNSSSCSSSTMCEYYCPSPYAYCGSPTKCYKPLTCADYSLCTSGSGTLSYPSDGCSGTITCRDCCGNGAIGSGEVCDKNGPVFDPSQDTCAEVNSSYDGGTLGCSSSCAFDTTSCCAWGSFSGWSDSGGYSDGAGGTCSKACDTGTQSRTKSCKNGSTTISTQSESQDCNTQACCVPKTCAELGCGYSGDDGCGTAISCKKTCADVGCPFRDPGNDPCTAGLYCGGCWVPRSTGVGCGSHILRSSCTTICGVYILDPGMDPNNSKTCKSDETSGSGGGTITVRQNVRCDANNIRGGWMCYNTGQIQDAGPEDDITACYCVCDNGFDYRGNGCTNVDGTPYTGM